MHQSSIPRVKKLNKKRGRKRKKNHLKVKRGWFSVENLVVVALLCRLMLLVVALIPCLVLLQPQQLSLLWKANPSSGPHQALLRDAPKQMLFGMNEEKCITNLSPRCIGKMGWSANSGAFCVESSSLEDAVAKFREQRCPAPTPVAPPSGRPKAKAKAKSKAVRGVAEAEVVGVALQRPLIVSDFFFRGLLSWL